MIAMRFRWAMAIFLLICFDFSVAFGCMYTVRDVGFVDSGDRPYRLYYYIRGDTPEELTATFKQISSAAFIDSNVIPEIINVDEQKDHAASEYLNFWKIESFPAAILVSPTTGQSLVLHISASNKPFKEVVWSALEKVVLSPKRKEVLQHIVRAYGVVVLIQGKEPAENKRAQKTIASAIAEIAQMMSQMPKPVKEPPRLVVIPPESFSQERILLWSLGVNESEISQPKAAVLYGRGRWIGPLLRGEIITANSLFNILSVIGSSCECGLDRILILGTRLPLRWGEKVQSRVAELLGFDPESPLVKTEMSQILSMGMSFRSEDKSTIDSLEVPLYGYREEAVEFESEPTVAMIPPVSSGQFRELDATATGSSGVSSTFRMTLFIIGGMFFLILVGGVFIIFRARQKAS